MKIDTKAKQLLKIKPGCGKTILKLRIIIQERGKWRGNTKWKEL